MNNRFRILALATAFVAALLPAATASAAKPGIDTTGATLGAFDGVQWCANSTVVSSWAITSGGNIALGSFAKNGKVTGGDAVLAVRMDLGSAPVSSLTLPGTTDPATGQMITVDAAHPSASGTVNVAPGMNWNNGIGFQPGLTTLAAGSGTAVVHLSLLTKKSESPSKAPGVTVNLGVTVGQCLGAVGAHTDHALTIGGGA
jgi:hypothetical protein